MNWRLLFILVAGYTVFFFLQVVALKPGVNYLRNRFQAEFGQPWSEENIATLSPEQRERWDSIFFDEYGRTPYRWVEGFFTIFHFPSILVLGAWLRQPTLSPVGMFFITGVTYVTVLYLLLQRWMR